MGVEGFFQGSSGAHGGGGRIYIRTRSCTGSACRDSLRPQRLRPMPVGQGFPAQSVLAIVGELFGLGRAFSILQIDDERSDPKVRRVTGNRQA
jgi:hypothetical protein